MQLTKDFILQEFVPSEIYTQFGDKSIWFIDPKIPVIVQALRDIFGVPVVINNWHTGGHYNNSGYRTPKCTEGALLSQHRFGRAADLKPSGMTIRAAMDKVKENYPMLKELGLTTVENIASTPTWLHIDTRWTGLDDLLIVNP